jgi:hypothetical protein
MSKVSAQRNQRSTILKPRAAGNRTKKPSIAAITEPPTARSPGSSGGVVANSQSVAMPLGRLIQLRKQGDSHGIAYIVAATEATEAMELVRVKVAGSSDAIEDCGRVSDELLNALQLSPGDISRADDPHGPLGKGV